MNHVVNHCRTPFGRKTPYDLPILTHFGRFIVYNVQFFVGIVNCMPVSTRIDLSLLLKESNLWEEIPPNVLLLIKIISNLRRRFGNRKVILFVTCPRVKILLIEKINVHKESNR